MTATSSVGIIALIVLVTIFVLLYKRTKNKKPTTRLYSPTVDNTPSDPKPEDLPIVVPQEPPVTVPPTGPVILSDINETVASPRKTTCVGRAVLDEDELAALGGNATFAWSYDIQLMGKGMLIKSGGGTRTSKFIELKLSRRDSPANEDVFVNGTVTCIISRPNAVDLTVTSQLLMSL